MIISLFYHIFGFNSRRNILPNIQINIFRAVCTMSKKVFVLSKLFIKCALKLNLLILNLFIKDPFCPVFQLNYIMTKAEADPSEIYQMLVKVIINLNFKYCVYWYKLYVF